MDKEVKSVLLTEKVVKKSNPDYEEIASLMKRAFPKEELFPLCLLRLFSYEKKCNFTAYFPDDNFVGKFVGLSYTVESNETLFVVYLAVHDSIQSQGYGSKILENLKQKYKNKSVTLFIETMDTTAEKADNYAQRVKRLAFYEKNGFTHLGISAGGKEPFVDILSTDSEFSLAQCKKLMKLIPMRVFPTG